MTATIAAKQKTSPGLAPLSLKDAPSFIEAQFPVGRLSAEAYKERDAGQGQTLTALGSYWKGRKPLIVARAVVLGCLLPATEDLAKDLDIFLMLMAMEDGAFGRRFDGTAAEFARLFPEIAQHIATNLTRNWRTDLSTEELRQSAAKVKLDAPVGTKSNRDFLEAFESFVRSKSTRKPTASPVEFAECFPDFADDLTEETEISWRWRKDVQLSERQSVIARAFASLPYAARLKYVRRPEECNEAELLSPIWGDVNRHIGTCARNVPELVEQLGVARFGHRPKVADTFCGSGQIPFEAARLGCEVYASDLNPIACMLTWGAFNIVGAAKQKYAEIEAAQLRVAASVDA